MTEDLKKITALRNELDKEIAERKMVEEKLSAAKEELEEKNRELEKLGQMKSDFVSQVSHELRTPMASIKEGIDIVLDGSAGQVNKEQREFLDIAKRNVDRLARLINNILDLQKIEAGRMQFNIQENDLNAAINEVCQSIASLVKDKGLDFIVKLDKALPKVQFDKDKIIQVLTNLISNAAKFTERGNITITADRQDNFIQVAVEDSGKGIKEEDLPKLFQKFMQLEKGLERKTGGTGLGLLISKEIIEAHKGRIWVKSEFGKGSTFYFSLPVK